MTGESRSLVVVDTGVFGANLAPAGQALTFAYRSLLQERRMAISFITDVELRFGATLAKWGQQRLQRLDAAIGRAKTIWPGPDLVHRYVALRTWCVRSGHGLGQKDHEADRWVAATALWLNVPLVAHDGIFFDVDGLELLTRLERPSTGERSPGTEPAPLDVPQCYNVDMDTVEQERGGPRPRGRRTAVEDLWRKRDGSPAARDGRGTWTTRARNAARRSLAV
jgi:predicted nucleic acid-binding protein